VADVATLWQENTIMDNAPLGPEERPFDPSRHLTKVSGRDYLEVKWRLVWLRSLHPEARIITELKQRQGQEAIFRAEIVLPSGASATGWGSEDAGDFGDYLEKAETKALGRALAALGFGTQFCDDFAFASERAPGRVVDSPVQSGMGDRSRPGPGDAPTRQSPPARPPEGPKPQTPRQKTYLWACMRERGLTDLNLQSICMEMFNTEEVAALSYQDLGKLINHVQDLPAATQSR
jgi:hypothetical protein